LKKEKKMANKSAAEHKDENVLYPLSLGESDPYRVKGSDFPNKGGSGVGGKPGHDDLCPESGNQVSPRFVEDGGEGEGGYGTPTEWQSGGRSKTVAANFPVGMNKGEGDEPAEKVDAGVSVDLVSGKVGVSGYKPTPVDEVGGPYVSIGRH
jgi:hypothetical protein